MIARPPTDNGQATTDNVVFLRKIAICTAIAALVLLLPTSASFTSSIRFTAAAGLLMALLWLTEALPMGLTALLPLVLFPLAGIRTAEKVAAPYANSAVFLFLGGFLVASCVAKWNLHRRVAYMALTVVGTKPRRIVLAVIIATAILSMWISNTATTLMLTPIAVAIVRGLGAGEGDAQRQRLATATLLGVAYGASLGGIGTPIGTPTNLIFLGAAKELFPNEPTISFAHWLGFGIVYLLFTIPLCWLILICSEKLEAGEAIPIEQLGLEKPGRFTRPERATMIVFTITALLWMFRGDISLGGLGTIPGWSNLFADPKAINDATVAIVMALVAFAVPVGNGQRLLGWSEFRKVPWDVLILFGGGFALADALEASGFSKWAGDQLKFIASWPPLLMILVLCLVVTLLSEVASNVATATAMMPVTAALAVAIGVHPYFLMIPTVLAASSGFMLPVATAPNTIVYGTGLVPVRKMARAGLLLDAVCAIVITMLIFFVIPKITGVPM
ncbi:MAG TPA: SLC13 family permease [Thermoanaerobaculia bacterium]